MKLENYEVHLPNYSIGNQIYDRIGPVCESYGRTVLVIGGEKALAAAYDKIERAVQKTNLQIIGKVLYGEDCTYAAVDRLRQMPLYRQADMVFGVGGGKALDTVKCLCIPDDKPVFAFPHHCLQLFGLHVGFHHVQRGRQFPQTSFLCAAGDAYLHRHRHHRPGAQPVHVGGHRRYLRQIL